MIYQKKPRKSKLVLKKPRSLLDVFLAMCCVLIVFLWIYSIFGIWAITESIEHPLSSLEPRENPIYQIFLIFSSTFCFAFIFFLSPGPRDNLTNWKKIEEIFVTVLIFSVFLTIFFYIAFIIALDGLRGSITSSFSRSDINQIAITSLIICFAMAIFMAVFLFFTGVKDDNEQDFNIYYE